MATTTAHRVRYTTATGASQVGRVFNAPDGDMAAMFTTDLFAGCTVDQVDAIAADDSRAWGEHDLGYWAPPSAWGGDDLAAEARQFGLTARD